MLPQPSSLPPLPSALSNSDPSPSFAEFAFSPNFGRPPSLQERLGYGPRIIPFKFHKPLPASDSTESETAAASEAMDIGHPIREDIAPETLPQNDSSLDAGPNRVPELATGPSPLPRKPPPDDIWTYAAIVQNEWASVERPPLSDVMTHIPKTSDDRDVSTTGPQILQGISTAFGTEQVSNRLPPTNGMSQQMWKHSEHTHHVSQSHTPGRIKEGKRAVEVKQEDLPQSLLALSSSLHAQVKATGSLDSESKSQIVKKEESPIQSARYNSQVSQTSSVVFNAADMHPTIVNGPTQGLTDVRHQSRILNGSHDVLHPKPGVTISSHLYSRTSRTSRPSQEFHAGEPKNQNTETLPPATRNITNPIPYYSPRNTAPFLGANAPLRSTSPSQIANQSGDDPQRHYQGRTHREPASTHVSQPTRSPGYASYNPRTTVGSVFSSPHSTSDDRGRKLRRELASLSARPAEGYRSYSPRRVKSPPRYPGRYRETSPRENSPHTPPYPSPREYLRRPSLRSRSHSRPPFRRVETFAPRRNEYPVDHRVRPHQSRSRSPRRRWSERGPRVPSPPRVPQYNFTRRDSAESYHKRIVNHNWFFPAERRPILSPHRSPHRIIVGADCYRPNREGRGPPITSSNLGTQNLDFLHQTPSPESANDADGPMHHGGVVIEVPEVAYSQRDSSVEHSPVAMQPDTIQQEENLSHTDRARRAMSDHAMSPRTPPRYYLPAEPIPNAPLRPGKRYRDQSESQSEAIEQELAADAEPGTKRRKLNAEDTDMLDVVANTRDPIGGKQDDTPPATASFTVGPIGMPVTEEYTLAPHSKHSIVQNKLWRRMAGNPPGNGAPQPASLSQTLPADPDEAFGIQERRNAQTSSVVSLENTSITSRISLKARLHGSQPQNNYVATRSNSPPPSSFEAVDPSGLLLNRVSSLKLTPPLQVGDPPDAQPSPLIGRIGFRPASVSPVNGTGEVAELSALRPAPKSRIPSLNDYDGSTLLARVGIVNEQSTSHLLARVGPSADQVPPQRLRQGSKGGRGAASRTYLGGNLADRLG